jgi:hypothetical protein
MIKPVERIDVYLSTADPSRVCRALEEPGGPASLEEILAALRCQPGGALATEAHVRATLNRMRSTSVRFLEGGMYNFAIQ